MNALKTSSRLQSHFSKLTYRHVRHIVASPTVSTVYTAPTTPTATTIRRINTERKAAVQELAKKVPVSYEEMSNDSLVVLSALEVEEACAEILKRHIMSQDSVDYSAAEATFKEIALANREGMSVERLPYLFAIVTATTAGFASFPLCFHEKSVTLFNEYFVTADIPPPEDRETWLEIGSWAWNWMEPPLGQISFFLLCLSFARAQAKNLGLTPYTRVMKTRRAERLIKRYPKYEPFALRQYSLSTVYHDK